MIDWLKWWWGTLWCEHEPGEWHMTNMGMGKVRYCRKCWKCLDRI